MGYPNSALGRLLGRRYRLDRLRYRLAFGSVFEALDVQKERRVAVHLFFGRGEPDSSFEKLARHLALVQRSPLTKILGTVRLSDGTGGLVSNLPAGKNLSEHLSAGPMTVEASMVALGRLLEGLTLLHGHGHLHLDLRPENIHLHHLNSSQSLEVSICGAGVQQLITRTVVGKAGEPSFGHPLFMAPEQWVGRETTEQTDLYTAGLIGYTFLTGRHFIRATDALEICRLHFTGERPRLETTPRQQPVPQALNQLLRTLTAADPSERPTSASDAISLLQDAWRETPSTPPEARPATPFSQPPLAMHSDAVDTQDVRRFAAGLTKNFKIDLS